MNGAGNKVGIEADPESSEQQDCFSCSTVISSKVSPDPRQTHRTGCVVSFYSSLFPCVPLGAWQVKRLLLRGGITKFLGITKIKVFALLTSHICYQHSCYKSEFTGNCFENQSFSTFSIQLCCFCSHFT